MDRNHPATPSNSHHMDSIDIVKGIAIILMVFGHTAQGAMHRHLWDAIPGAGYWMGLSNSFVYSFHMPAFFFVSGLFIAGSVKRRGTAGFILEKLKTLLYPYLLWSVLSGLIDPITSHFRASGEPSGWMARFSSVLSGNASWFLMTLFVCQLLALVVLRAPHWVQMVVALAGCLLIPPSNITVLYRPFQDFPFVVAGMWVGSQRVARLESLSRLASWGGFAGLFVVQYLVIARWGATTRWDMVPIGLAGIAMLLLLSQGLHGTLPGRVLRWYGEGSLGHLRAFRILSGNRARIGRPWFAYRHSDRLPGRSRVSRDDDSGSCVAIPGATPHSLALQMAMA